MKLTLLLLASCLGVCLASLGRTSYEGHQVLAVTPETKAHLELLQKWMLHGAGLDFWEEPNGVGTPSVFMAPPSELQKVKDTLDRHQMPYVVQNDNVQRQLDTMWEELDHDMSTRSAGMAFNYDNFNTHEDTMAEVEALASECSSRGLTCTTYSLGDSYEGREIKMLKISRGPGRQAYWLDSTIHAREWLAPATTMKVANHLIRNYGSDSDATRMVDKYDWYILPVMNPDGYVYTRTSRYWRKNRKPNGGCIGTDLNRNFDYRHGTEGVSTNPCSEVYCGPFGASEPETQAVQNEIQRLKDDILALVTVHAYGRMWMFPWGNTRDGWYCDRAEDHTELMRVADATANAIERTYNTRWARGNSCEVIYETTGGTDDYAKGRAGIKYAFCPELRGSDFVVNRSDIDRSFREVFNGLVAMTEAIAEGQ